MLPCRIRPLVPHCTLDDGRLFTKPFYLCELVQASQEPRQAAVPFAPFEETEPHRSKVLLSRGDRWQVTEQGTEGGPPGFEASGLWTVMNSWALLRWTVPETLHACPSARMWVKNWGRKQRWWERRAACPLHWELGPSWRKELFEFP